MTALLRMQIVSGSIIEKCIQMMLKVLYYRWLIVFVMGSVISKRSTWDCPFKGAGLDMIPAF